MEKIPSGGVARALCGNVRAGFELAAFRSVDRARFKVSIDQIVLLVVFNLVLAFVWGGLVVKGPSTFDLSGWSVHATWLITVFGLAWIASRESEGGASELARTSVILLAPLSVGWLGYASLNLAYENSVAFHDWVLDQRIYWVYVFVVWIAFVYANALRVATGLPRHRAWSLAMTYGIAVWMVFSDLSSPYFWFTDYPAKTAASTSVAEPERLDVEAILHEQRSEVERRVESLAPDRPGIVDLYFVGFGADARQDVFKKEVEYIGDLMDRRFDTQNRSILLVNHRDTLGDHPLATASNLADAVHGIAKRMNPREDILVIYTTSHGSKKHSLSVKFPRFPLNPITPPDLERMIETAGIEWPMLIVSACYSGGYIEPLRGSQRYVATSAAADRTSFGCGDDSDMTYFGRAFFEEQLEKTHDFASAFAGARASVEERETAKGLTPSLPQLALGDEMAIKLQGVRDRLDGVTRVARAE